MTTALLQVAIFGGLCLLAVGGLWLLDLLLGGGVELVCSAAKVSRPVTLSLHLLASGTLIFFAVLGELELAASGPWEAHLVGGSALAFTVFLAVRRVRRSPARARPP